MTIEKADEKYLNQIFPKGKIEFNAPQTKPDTAFVYSIQGIDGGVYCD